MEELPDNICEECKEEDESVRSNLMTHGYKICDSCKLSKTIFPVQIPLKRTITKNKKNAWNNHAIITTPKAFHKLS